MGLTLKSVGMGALADDNVFKKENTKLIAIAGNPNVGKSTLFNSLTGMKQHTGNWPGKTVSNAVGEYRDKNNKFTFVDIPGTYSLDVNSAEEEVARDFLAFSSPDAVVVVCDATCLERNLNLALQIMQICKNVIICVNLLDEAAKKGIKINLKRLGERLGVPVIGTSARYGKGIKELISTLEKIFAKSPVCNFNCVAYPKKIEDSILKVENELKKSVPNIGVNTRWLAIKLLENDQDSFEKIKKHKGIKLLDNDETLNAILAERKILEYEYKDLKKHFVSSLVLTAEMICDGETVIFANPEYRKGDGKIDRILTGKITGIAVMLGMLAFIFWLTIWGANYPSEILWQGLSFIEGELFKFGEFIGLNPLVSNMLFGGIYRVVAWIVSVMLPPMAIFFPLFTLLEDFGFLPRVAFNLDKGFKKCSSCGKQALTMCMGFGCNAAGITGSRIIDSKRERLIAIITNNFVPCNGRFPTIIAIISMFFVASSDAFLGSFTATMFLISVILLGIFTTFFVSKLLSKTLLKGEQSKFVLELPPFRKPKIGSIIIRSIFDRTLFVLGRALMVAAPAGLVIWLMANIKVNSVTLLSHCSAFLDPLGRLMGMDGVILLGFILGFPANEIVIPIIIMAYMSKSQLTDYSELSELKNLLVGNGWTIKTAICTVVFSLMHWPCSTALLTAKKETGSKYWTFVTFALPTTIGMLICILINLFFMLF